MIYNWLGNNEKKKNFFLLIEGKNVHHHLGGAHRRSRETKLSLDHSSFGVRGFAI